MKDRDTNFKCSDSDNEVQLAPGFPLSDKDELEVIEDILMFTTYKSHLVNNSIFFNQIFFNYINVYYNMMGFQYCFFR